MLYLLVLFFATDTLYVDNLKRMNPVINPNNGQQLDWVDIIAREAYYAN